MKAKVIKALKSLNFFTFLWLKISRFVLSLGNGNGKIIARNWARNRWDGGQMGWEHAIITTATLKHFVRGRKVVGNELFIYFSHLIR